MAASMRSICGCTSTFFMKAVNRTNLYLPCKKNGKAASLLKTCLTCVRAHVTAAEEKGAVTSICHLGRSPYSLAGVAVSGGTAAESSSRKAFISTFHRFLFPFKHKAQTQSALFHCRHLCSQNAMQTESKKTADDINNQTGSEPCSQCCDKNSEKELKTNNKVNTCSRKPEKKENIKTIPNLLTTLRMASSPLLGYLVVCESFGWALSLFAVAGITDLLDGYIARKFPNQSSALGSALDPLADKLLVTILTISMTSVGLIPLPLTGLIVFRDVSLIAGGFYIRYRSLLPPITLSRYFDVSHATVNLAPTFISKLNTGLQLSLVAVSLAAPVFGFVDHIGLQALWWTTGATTFLSGTDYLCSWKKYVTLLEKDQKEL